MSVETLQQAEPPAPYENGGLEVLEPSLRAVSQEVGKIISEESFEIALPSEQLATPEAIETRTAEALENCDFEPNPEMAEQLSGFFADHYEMATDIQTILDENVETLTPAVAAERKQELSGTAMNDADLEGIIEYGNMPAAISRLVRPSLNAIHRRRLDNPSDPGLKRAELMLLSVAVDTLFAEPSLAVTTVGEKELAIVQSLASQILDKVKGSGFAELDKYGRVSEVIGLKGARKNFNTRSLEVPGAAIRRAQKSFWKDTRPAGQLLFHNSPTLTEIRLTGSLLPRRMQKKVMGSMRTNTIEQTSDGHIHSPTVHWSEVFDPATFRGEEGESGGSIGVPLREIVEVAPYARDAAYGVLRVKPGHQASVNKKVTTIDQVGDFGVGRSDLQGIIGLDRTFYSSSKDVAADEAIEEAPDGHKFKLGPNDYTITIGETETQKAEVNQDENSPAIRAIDAPEAVAATISSLQGESIARWPEEIVAPLRSGVFDFYVPDDSRYPGRHEAEFTKAA